MKKNICIFLILLFVVSCMHQKQNKSPIEYSFNYFESKIYLKNLNYEVIDKPFYEQIKTPYYKSIDIPFKKILTDGIENEIGVKFIMEFQFHLDGNLVYLVDILKEEKETWLVGMPLSSKTDYSSEEIKHCSIVEFDGIEYVAGSRLDLLEIENNKIKIKFDTKWFFRLLKSIKNGSKFLITARYKLNGVNKTSEFDITKDKFELKTIKDGHYKIDDTCVYFALPINEEEIDKTFEIDVGSFFKPYFLIQVGYKHYSLLGNIGHEEIVFRKDSLYPSGSGYARMYPIDTNSVSMAYLKGSVYLGESGFNMVPIEDKLLFYGRTNCLLFHELKKTKAPITIKFRRTNGKIEKYKIVNQND